MCAAVFLFSIMSACAKILSEHYHVVEIAFWRNLVFVGPMFFYMLLRKGGSSFRTHKPLGVFLRGACGTLSLIVTYAALAALPLSDATVLFFTANLLVPAMAHFFLKEYVGIHRWAAILVGFVGVMLVAGPTGMMSAWGVSLALLAASLHAVIHIVLRHLKTESALTVTFYFVLAGVLIPAPFMPFLGQGPQSGSDGLLFLLLGLSGGVAQLCLSSAYRNAPVSVVAPFNYTGLIWSTGFDIVLWRYVPGWPVFVGGAIILGSKLYILHRERLYKRRA